MQLRQRLESRPESLRDFAVAAEYRFLEGLELATRNHHFAGIYLLGYAAEMYLKIAAFRFDGASPSTLVYPQLQPVRRWMLLRHPKVEHEGFHSLRFWLQYLRSRRQVRGQALDRNFDGALVHHVNRIYSIWWVEMRYRPDRADIMTVNRMFNDVSWLRRNQHRIGS
jgi:hypothetical protein